MTTYILRNYELQIEDAKFEGEILVSGRVVNGGWYYRVRDGEQQACRSAESVEPETRWPYEPQEVFEVPKGFRGDPFAWAKTQVLPAKKDSPT